MRKTVTLAGPKPKQRPQKRWRIYRGEARGVMLQKVSDVLRVWTLSPFEFEASTRIGIRNALVLEGHGWQKADDEAAGLVEEALHLLGAVRPTWYQGQPQYSAGHEYCLGCRGPLDEETMTNGRRFCCDDCAKATYIYRPELFRFASSMARCAAFYAAAKAQIPERPCKWCGTVFKPATTIAVSCSPACAARIKKNAVPERRCLSCDKLFRGRSKKSRYCSIQCIRDHARIALPKRPCEYCGVEFQPTATFSRFCSDAHRAKAGHLRRKQAREAEKPAESTFICEDVTGFREAAE